MDEDSQEHEESAERRGAGAVEDQFKFVFGALVDLFKWYMSLVRDVIVFSLLVIGWLVTSKYSRAYIKEHEAVLYIALGVMGAIYLMFILEALKSRKESARKMGQLAEIGFADEKYYDNYKITGPMVILSICLVGIVFGLLVAILLTV